MRSRNSLIVMGVLVIGIFVALSPARAFDAYDFNKKVAESVTEFNKQVKNSDEIMDKAAGVLICPSIKKVGLGVALERGACALQIDGETVEYYRASNASYGLTAGAHAHGEIVAFMTAEELDKFRDAKREWKIGVDGGATVATLGAGGVIDLSEITEPMVVIPYDQKGLMADLSIEGGTYKKIGSAEDYAKYGVPLHRFVVTADVSDPAQRGAATAQMTIDIQGWIGDAERMAMRDVIAKDGTVAARNTLAEMPAIGVIRGAGKTTKIQWARAVEMDNGNYRVILATTDPVEQALAAQQMAQAKDKFSIMQLDINEKHVGTGVLLMGPELRYDEKTGVTVHQRGQLSPIKLSSVSYEKLD